MTCTHHLAGGPLVCVRTDDHLTGHVYHSTLDAVGDDREGAEQ